jgi:hypothetical protein
VAETTTTIAIKHKPIQYFVPDKRIKIDTEVTDKEAIKLVRCYFRAAGEAGYVFVPMEAGKEGVFESILPAPGKNTKTLEYLFLVVNEKNQIVRSQVFTADKKDDDKAPAWQQVTSEGDIHVSTELANVPTTPPGFSDSIVLDVVESGARFGLVAEGIYTASQIGAAGGATGTAAVASSAGVVIASAGMSTLAIVGIGAAVAAVAGGAAAAASSSKGDDSPAPAPAPTPAPGPVPTPAPITTQSLVGAWQVTGSSSSATTNGTITLNSGGTFTYSLLTNSSGGSSSQTGTGAWYLSGLSLALAFDKGAVYSGTAQGTSSSFSMVCNNGWTLYFNK